MDRLDTRVSSSRENRSREKRPSSYERKVKSRDKHPNNRQEGYVDAEGSYHSPKRRSKISEISGMRST
jgi:hypothetical protein